MYLIIILLLNTSIIIKYIYATTLIIEFRSSIISSIYFVYDARPCLSKPKGN